MDGWIGAARGARIASRLMSASRAEHVHRGLRAWALCPAGREPGTVPCPGLLCDRGLDKCGAGGAQWRWPRRRRGW